MTVVALGKAGGREMMAGSDLDLMFIYDHPDGETESRVARGSGARRLPVSQWFVRAAHSYVAALTAPGAEGQLYAIDMRLRPSGNKGPVAVALAGFERYHAESAWTWEHMALTRSRMLAAPPVFAAKIDKIIRSVLCRQRSAAEIAGDVCEMREAVANERGEGERWNIKDAAGGLLDIEFIAQ